MKTPVTLIYSRHGTVAHVKDFGGLNNPMCPLRLFWYEWLGTGSQDEYDKAASLPLCKRCARFIS